MAASLLKRLLVIVPTLLGVSILAFGLIRLVPGDPVLLLIGERGASPEVYAEMRANLGLDQSLLNQYMQFVGRAVTGDLGTSIISKRPVMEEFLDRFPATVELGFLAMILAIAIGIPVGIVAAVKRNSFLDYFFIGVSLIGYSMPIFWWGLILILVFSVSLGWTPVSGRIDVLYDIEPVTGFMLIDSLLSEEGWPAFWDALRHLALPAMALGTIPLAVVTRMTRSSLLEVLGEDYIRTAKAQGDGSLWVVCVYAMRNALIPVVTVIGLMFGSIITGAILTETIFSWPGIGKWLVHSVTARDYPVIQGGILLIACLVIMINMGVDLMNSLVNPKLRDLQS
ncbi:MAG: dipeptide ABC transporter permease DppB [Zetaproteobacteria bacterium]|nr:dipeptide ABC transporter permease DppB [Pseudobdellovibrionaceae bacterium]